MSTLIILAVGVAFYWLLGRLAPIMEGDDQ